MINNGNGKFQLVSLPVEAQMASVFGIITQDFNMDGFTDILLAGNDYSLELVTGRIDASNGLLLLGNEDVTFKTLKLYESGFIVKGDAMGISNLFDRNGNEVTLTAQNKDLLNAHLYIIENNDKIIDPNGALWADIKLKNGKQENMNFTMDHHIYLNHQGK